MLVQLGKRNEVIDAVDLLYECHGRIRRFLEMARSLAGGWDAATDLVRDTARQIRRYFAVALPLHIADEDELVIPRLRGRSEQVDEALDLMHLEHLHHAPLVERLIELCATLEREPEQLARLSSELDVISLLLHQAFEPHLEREETILFPALRTLPAKEREAIKAGMRARRENF